MKRHGYLLLVLIASCLSCKRAPQPPARPDAGPQVRATAITIRTTIQPDKRTFDQTILVVGDRARHLGEQDTWRLYDTKARSVTFIDEVAGTLRTEPFTQILQRRRAVTSAALPPHYAPAAVSRTDERRVFHGASARRVLITAGRYQRELWFAEHPRIPRGLFAMISLSETPSSPLAPMMRAVDEAVAAEAGFPMRDRTTMPLREGNVIVERSVVAIGERNVSEALLAPPRSYKDLTPAPKKQ